MIERIIDKLIVRFMEQIFATRDIEEKTEMTPGKNQETQPGKRRRTQEPAPLIRAKVWSVDKTSVHGTEDHPIYVNCGGTPGIYIPQVQMLQVWTKRACSARLYQ